MATINSINSNIPIELSKGGTNATTMATTDGVVYYDGTRLVTTAAGTAAQVLTSNGPGVAPTFQAAPAVKLTLIQSLPASNSATIDFTTGITSTYATYFFLISNVVPISAGSSLQMVVSTDGGANWIGGTDYTSGCTANPFNANTWANNNISAGAAFVLSPALSTTAPPYSSALYFYNITNGLVPNFQGSVACRVNGGQLSWGASAGYMATTVNINAFRFQTSSGNISTGTFTLYGLKES